MKKVKSISPIISALMLISLISAFQVAPAGANGAVPNPTFATVSISSMTTPSAEINIGWEYNPAIAHSGDDAIHVTTSTQTSDYAMVIVPTYSPLEYGTEISYWGYTVSGSDVKAPDEIYLFLDTDDDGTIDNLLTSHKPGPAAPEWYGEWHEWSLTDTANEWHTVNPYAAANLADYIENGYTVLAIALTAGPSTTSGAVNVDVYFDELTVNGGVVLDDDTGTIEVPESLPQFPALSIQDAIDAALSGDTVLVGPGTYNERLTISKSIDLRGAQYGVDPTATGTRTNPADESIVDLTGLPVQNPNVLIEIASGASGASVAGFTLIGSPTFHYSDESIVRCWSNDITIEGNIMDGYVGVLYKGGTGLTVHQNRMVVNKNGVVVQPNPATNVTISSNVLSLGTNPVGDESAIYMTSCSQSSVTGNTASGFVNNAALAGSNLDHLTVSGNTFTGNAGGISIWGSSTFITISNNMLSNSLTTAWADSGCGISIKGQDLEITGNEITNNGDIGIKIARHVIDTERVTVSNNNIYGNTNYGLWVDTGQVTEIINAENNWWGNPTGPRNPTTNSSATGDDVSDNVDYTPWLDAPYPGGNARSWNVQNVDTEENFNSIQAAVDAASPGDTVLVYPGAYEEEVTVYVDDLTLIGVGGPGSTVLDASGYDFGFSVQADGVTIDNFTVANSDAGIEVYGEDIEEGSVTIQNNVIENTDSGGIIFYSNIYDSTVTIENNLIQSCYGVGIDGINFWNWVDYIDYSRIVIENNRIINNSGMYAVDLDAEIYSSEIVIVGNTLDNNGNDGIYCAGIQDGNVLIENNSITNNDWGIDFGGIENSEVEITGNTMDSNSEEGIDFYGPIYGSTVLIENNSISNNGREGILFDGDIENSEVGVAGNTVDNNGEYAGIYFWNYIRGSTVLVENNSISNNGEGAGIGFDRIENSEVWIAGNTMDNNYWEGIGFWDYIRGSTVLVENNSITNSTWQGIYLDRIRDSHVLMENNSITNNGRDGIDFGGGIENSEVGITGNTVDNNDLDGIYWVSIRDSHVLVENNSITNNKWGIGFDSIENSEVGITGNTMDNNEYRGIVLWFPIYSSTVLMENNSISNSDWGIGFWGGIENSEVGVAGNTVDNNDKYEGIGFYDTIYGSTVLMENNSITNNDYRGIAFYCIIENSMVGIAGNTVNSNFGEGIFINALVDATGIAVNYNNIVGNVPLGVNNLGIGTLDATYNWWGDPTGPRNPTTNPSATGDNVSDNVDYTPWLDAPYLTGVARSWNVQNVDTGDNFNSIQAAIDNASAGETIIVEEGTYNETITFASDFAKDNLTIEGDAANRPVVTGGVHFGNNNAISDLALKNLYLKGDGSGGLRNRVVDMKQSGAVNNFTMDNCVIDGENVDGRHGICGRNFGQDFTIVNTEFKNILGWALMDINSGSGDGANSLPLDTVTLANNYVHNCNGSVALRGHAITKTTEVNAYGNTFDNIGGNEGQEGQHWAALEVNHTVTANVYNNTVNNVAEGEWGEGQAFQFWDIDTLNVYNNDITNNYQGIFIYGGDGGTYGGPYAVPGGSIYHNNIVGNEQYGIMVDANATDGPLDATLNWWGDPTGPRNPTTNSSATGDDVSDYVDYMPWLDASYLTGVARNWNVQNVDTGDNFNSIQAAIDVAEPGETVLVHPGTYTEAPRIDEALTVRSTDGAEKTIIYGTSYYIVYIRHSDVTFDGFTITYPTFEGSSDISGILVGAYLGEPVDNVHILNNIVKAVRNGTSGTPSTYGATGINIGRTPLTNVIVSGNTIENIKNPEGGASDHTCGINVWDGAENVLISNNAISDIKYNGIILEYASNVRIENNAITECEVGIRVEPYEGATVANLTINYNNVAGNREYGVLNTMMDFIDATLNWWGDPGGPGADEDGNSVYGDDVSANVSYDPWLPRPLPTISDISVSGVTTTSATITWTTALSADSRVEYGPTIAYGLTSSIPDLTTSHSLGLTGLTPSTTYHFRVRSEDAYGHVDNSGDLTFITAAPPPPPVPATLTVDTTPIKANLYVDGSLLGVAPRTRSLAAGTYTISFGDVLGYLTPAPEIVTLAAGETKTVEGVYTEIPPENIENQSPTYDLPSITPDENATILVENTALTDITIQVKNAAENVKITVQEVTEDAAGIAIGAPGATYKYLNIVAENITDAQIGSVAIRFKVEKSWIIANEIDIATITLNRYDSLKGEWTSLPTTYLSEDDTYVYFSAISPGLSIFGVSGSTIPANFELSNLVITPSEVSVGKTVTISVVVNNVGGRTGSTTVTLEINGVAVDTRSATLDAGKSTTVTFTVSEDVAGTYTINIAGLMGSFVVKAPAPSIVPLVMGIIIIVLAIGIVMWFWRIRRRA